MKMYSRLLILFVLLGMGCQEKQQTGIQFYHWKSYLNMTASEKDYLGKLEANTIYLRYFDVGMEGGQPAPLGKLVPQSPIPEGTEIIPTIFMTNETFKILDGKGRAALVNQVIRLIRTIHTKLTPTPIGMVQFDCDWTDSTRGAYFEFLKSIQAETSWKVSVTIRLHQIKYAERTGIPPADHFVLMCYNTGEVGAMDEKNSILQTEVVKQYISDSSYPKTLDVALPLFAWGVLYRDGELIKLIRNVNMNTFKGNPKYSLGADWVEVLESTYLNGYYLYEGDRLRIESSERSELVRTAEYLADHLHPENVIFYHLDSIIINQYEHEFLESLSQHFTHY